MSWMENSYPSSTRRGCCNWGYNLGFYDIFYGKGSLWDADKRTLHRAQEELKNTLVDFRGNEYFYEYH